MSTSYGFLGTPPTQCGLATFSRSLMRALTEPGSDDTAGIVRVVDMPVTVQIAPEVVGHLHTQSADAPAVAAAVLNTFDATVVQHDYAIYGGRDGDQLLSVLGQLRGPGRLLERLSRHPCLPVLLGVKVRKMPADDLFRGHSP